MAAPRIIERRHGHPALRIAWCGSVAVMQDGRPVAGRAKLTLPIGGDAADPIGGIQPPGSCPCDARCIAAAAPPPHPLRECVAGAT